MKFKELVKEAASLASPYSISKGKNFRLKDYAPEDTSGIKDKQEARKTREHSVQLLSEFQEKLYAQDRWALLIIFSGHGRRREGRGGQACHVRHQPRGL
jgi:hypothetical protein